MWEYRRQRGTAAESWRRVLSEAGRRFVEVRVHVKIDVDGRSE